MCNKKCGTMTHQETTDRINALASALGSLQGCPTHIKPLSGSETRPVQVAIDDIAKELSKLASSSNERIQQPPKAPTAPEARIIIENGKPQD